ncbi:hypothetical protein E3P96_02499 [Wallemia ichthyophaga]|nr:hypothetical protein E3P96_02499 [Wallemia ichthyophaga]
MLQYFQSAILLLTIFAVQKEYTEQRDCYALRVSAPHRRMRPVGSSFNNKFLYVLYRLRNTSTSNGLFSESAQRTASLLRVSPSMYFSEHYSRSGYSILDNLKQVLRERGYDPDAMCHTVWLMTLPITLGISHVNNVSVAWVYAHGRPTCTIFCTHNSSGQRHVYLVDHNKAGQVQAAAKDSGYQYTATMARAHHVSPTEPRSGYYRFTWTSPFDGGGCECKCNCQHAPRKPNFRTTVFDEHMQALLVGRLEVESVEKMNATSVVHLLKDYTFSNIKIALQFVKTGWYMHVKRGLRVHPAPPLTSSRMNPTQTGDMTGFMGLPAQPVLSRWAQRVVESVLLHTLNTRYRDVCIRFEYTDRNITPVTLLARNAGDTWPSQAIHTLHITIRSFEFYKQLLISPNPMYAVDVLTQNCEDLARVSDARLFVDIFSATRISDGRRSVAIEKLRGAYVRMVSEGTHGTHGSQNVDGKISLHVESFVSASWMTIFIITLIYLEWWLIKSFYERAGIRIIPRLTPWRPFDRLQGK